MISAVAHFRAPATFYSRTCQRSWGLCHSLQLLSRTFTSYRAETVWTPWTENHSLSGSLKRERHAEKSDVIVFVVSRGITEVRWTSAVVNPGNGLPHLFLLAVPCVQLAVCVPVSHENQNVLQISSLSLKSVPSRQLVSPTLHHHQWASAWYSPRSSCCCTDFSSYFPCIYVPSLCAVVIDLASLLG